jgi:hypothetical protein
MFPLIPSCKAKPVHMRGRVNVHGRPVAVCSQSGLSIKPEREGWTAIRSMVTCEECKRLIENRDSMRRAV